MKKISEILLSRHLRTLKPYESARRLFSGGQLWLNANESPFANDYQIDPTRFNRYPDCQPHKVIRAYAEYAGLQSEQVLVSRGADEGIELLVRAFCTPAEDSILICPPTYGMYAISAETFNVGVHRAPLKEDFSLDLSAMKTFVGKTKLVFICSPNNPTGTRVAREQIEQVLEWFADSALVVVDEAYIEFDADNAWASAIADYPNLVVLRTLSKAFALAGLRCGFTLANAEVIQSLLKVIAPYPVPEPVAQIAEQALSPTGLAKVNEQVQALQLEKSRLAETLPTLGDITLVGDDKANFLLIRTAAKQELMDYLVAQGLLIRDQSKQMQLENCLRVSVGTAPENDQLVDAIQHFFAQQETAV